MPEYYIRTPEQDESRGPFNINKLLTLAEAGQVTENSLYYDEENEEWVPIALNEELKAQVFPKSESLKLHVGEDDQDKVSDEDSKEESGLNVQDMLKAAEADTEETRHLKRSQKSFERAVALASLTLGLMMLLSAVLLLLSVTEIYPLIRGRSMLGLGFGVYLGWALGDPLLMLAFGLGCAGVFLATLAQRLSVMLLAIVMGVGGNGALAFLAINDRFVEFYSSVQLNLFTE